LVSLSFLIKINKERILNRKTIREKDDLLQVDNCQKAETTEIKTFLINNSNRSKTEYFDFLANLNRIDLHKQMEKKIRKLKKFHK